MRAVFYMATLSAVRYNPMPRRFYERLKMAGKVGKAALIAGALKLLTVSNPMVWEGTRWDAVRASQAR